MEMDQNDEKMEMILIKLLSLIYIISNSILKTTFFTLLVVTLLFSKPYLLLKQV